MKIFLIWIFFLLYPAITLAGAEGAGSTVYIQPVTGGTREDNQYITNLLTVEIRAYNFTMVDTSARANYTFITTLTPESSQPAGNPAGIYNLHIMLRDNRLRETISEQDLLFSSSNKEMLNNNFQFLIIRMIATIAPSNNAAPAPSGDALRDMVREAVNDAVREANEREAAKRDAAVRDTVKEAFGAAVEDVIAAKPVPEEPEIDPNKWRNGNFYLGGLVAWAPRAYIGDYESAYLPNVSIGLTAEYHFLKRFSVESGFSVTSDWVALDPDGAVDYRELMLEIPLSFKFTFKPATYFMLQPYAGMLFNIAVYGTIKPPPVAWMAGFQYGVKAGPGAFIIDPRFSMDITKSRLNEMYGRPIEFDRIKMYVGFGYKYSFF